MMRTTQISSCAIQLAAFIVLCLGCHWPQALCEQGPGWVSPTIVEQRVGGSFNLSCTINKTYFQLNTNQICEVQDLYFKTKHANRKFTQPPDIWRENATTIIYTARNVSEQEDDYLCMCDKYAIMPAKVYVGTEPLLVNDFNCLGYDSSYMVCNFTMPHNNLITKYNVSFVINRKDSNYRFYVDCNYDAAPAVTCNITDDNVYKKFADIFYFRLDISNSLGSDSQSIEINNFERMVPARPGQNLTVVNTTASSICLSWEMPRRSNYVKGLKWDVKVEPKNFSAVHRNSWRNKSVVLLDTLCLDQLPYAGYDYSLQLRVRSDVANSIWSEPLLRTLHTASERPRRPPRVTSGSFYVYSSETQLRFYWEQLQPHEYNGQNFTYVISEYRKNGLPANDSQIFVESNSAVILKWNKDAYHEIFLRSKNSVDNSISASRLTIPAISDADLRVRVPKNIRSVYHSNSSSYTLSWEAPEDHEELVNYTVFWCNAKPALQSECEGSIHFQNVSSDQRIFTTTPGQTQTLNMAVSANFERFNTGMHWLICTRDVTDDLAKMEPTIDEVTNSSMTVKWSTERVCPVILEGYNLTYCQRSPGQPDNCTTVVVSNRYAKLYRINDLQPYTDYSVKMLMFSEAKASKYSDELIQRTGEASPSPPRALQFGNITSSSVTLSWKPPLKANGVVRSYEGSFRHNNKTERFRMPAFTDQLVDNERRVYFELTNLTAYTHYSVHIRAWTEYSSIEHSNEVELLTSVGVPSAPKLHFSTTKDEHTTLDWSPPLEPAGRIDYYEVAVSEHTKNALVSRVLSYIVARQNRSCVLATPKCTPLNRFQYQVRAVNVERLQQTENEAQLKVNLRDDSALDSAPQLCVAELPLSQEELRLISDYNNEQLYRQHWSEWSSYGVSCSPDNSSTKTLMSGLEVFAAIIVIGIACHFGYVKYRTMSNIDCTLPAGIDNWKKPTEIGSLGLGGNLDGVNGGGGGAGGGIICITEDSSPHYMLQHSQDFSYGNESAKLLLSAVTTPGRCTDNESSIYTYVDNADTEASDGDGAPRDSNYMSMQPGNLPQSSTPDYASAAQLNALGNSNTSNANANALAMTNGSGGYIKPTQMKSWSTPQPQLPSSNANTLPNPHPTAEQSPALSMPLSGGYMPVHLLKARQAAATAAASPPAKPSLPPISGYVQAADLLKLKQSPTAIAPPSVAAAAAQLKSGYTTMMELERAGLLHSAAGNPGSQAAVGAAVPVGTNGANGQTRLPPHIGGYVTQQDLNALAHNRHVL